jgi:hypothetical protein
VGEAIGLALLVNEVRQGISDRSTAQSKELQTQLSTFLGQAPSKDAIANALAGVEQGINDLQANPLNVLVQGEALDNLRKMRDELKIQLAEAAGARLTGDLGRHSPMRLMSPLVAAAAALDKIQRELRVDFRAAVAALRDATNPADMLAAVARLVVDVRGGVGGPEGTKALVADLTARRNAALAVGDQATADALTAALKKIEPFVKGREWQQAQIAQGRRIVEANRTNAQKIADLRTIQKELLRHQDTSAAKQLQALIDIVAAVKGINIGNAFTPSREGDNGASPIVPGRDPRRPGPVKPPSLPGGHPMVVNASVSVSTRDVNTSQSVRGRYGPTPTQAGAA